MLGRLLHSLSILVGGVALLLLLATLWVSVSGDPLTGSQTAPVGQPSLPKGVFVQSQEGYDAIGKPFLSLTLDLPALELPDLRQHLIYYGTNRRPDAESGRTMFHFSLKGVKTLHSVAPGEPLYLRYDRSTTPPRYIFSPDNMATALWIEAKEKQANALVVLKMKDENGEYVSEPEAHAQFSLPEKEFLRFGDGKWELDHWRVDGTLLARQKARWFGRDLFLERHGGELYHHIKGKERIDFGGDEKVYSYHVSEGDCLVWKDGRWSEVQPGSASRACPLLHVKKINDKLMSCELWDVEGKRRANLNLIRSTEMWVPSSVYSQFKFIGARTRSQYILDIGGERILLKPQDWLVLRDGQWKKLGSAEEIDGYVNRTVAGVLFIFEGMSRQGEQQVLSGTLYNASRTKMENFQIAVQGGGATVRPSHIQPQPPIENVNVESSNGDDSGNANSTNQMKTDDSDQAAAAAFESMIPRKRVERRLVEAQGEVTSSTLSNINCNK